jgi:hypothetical protein
MPYHPISPRSILILTTHLHLGLPSGRFPSEKKGIRRRKNERKRRNYTYTKTKQRNEKSFLVFL